MRKKRKEKNIKITRVLYNMLIGMVLFVGILFVFYEPIKNWIAYMGIGSINMVSASDIETNQKKKATFNFEEVKELDLKTLIQANLHKDEITVIGGISIPSVQLNLAIGKGTSNYTLALTAGTMKEEQLMGKGNYALAGHHMTKEELLFGPLFEVEIGARVYMTDLKYVYEYQINEQRTIEATDIEVIEDVKGENLLTLITCDNEGEDRLLTRGHFVQKIPIGDASDEITDAFQLDLNDQ
ncbi:sortase [Agaribacter marinus]|uniref:Class A sortase n=1 Tax=Virgibacillus salarius TaxID=447199 RepID=A0A941DU05_9BACI|nr:class A sortase [Virgibacillus salarius]MBR7796645.1 class A sortase [Virgibacillus salarius]NAZ09355.1 sortase [Agaribacter marinus]